MEVTLAEVDCKSARMPLPKRKTSGSAAQRRKGGGIEAKRSLWPTGSPPFSSSRSKRTVKPLTVEAMA